MRSRKPAKSDRQFQTVPQVAEMLGVGPNKILGWIRTGDIVATDLSQSQNARPRWHIATAEVDRFVAARRSVPATTPIPVSHRKPKSSIVEFVK